MHSHHGHDSLDSHAGRRSRSRRRLAWTLGLAASYMLAELIGGLLANSLALLADAGHMLSDVASLGLGLFAVWIADRPSPPQQTYGYYRAEILAALANGALLVGVSLFIFVEAFRRLGEPPAVQGPLMLGIAVGGLAINLAGLWILHGEQEHSLNVRGAWLHVLSDALGSLGVIAAASLVFGFGWNWADPVASIVIGGLVIYSAWRLLAEAVSVLMENAPGHIDVDKLHTTMQEIPGVVEVHDLHVWTITSGLESLSAHVVVADGRSHTTVLETIRNVLHDRFGIDHLTIQIEPEDFDERRIPV